MKAEINEEGTLTIIAETGIESFALMAWSDRYVRASNVPGSCEVDGRRIIFDGSLTPSK